MNYQDEINSHPEKQDVQKTPRYEDFTDSVFGKLRGFNVEEQVEILHKLYRKLEEIYQLEMQTHIKHAEDFKQRLEILKKLEPKK